jgi:hypothetical protein
VILEAFQIDSGCVFQDAKGRQVPMSYYEQKFYYLLTQIRGQFPELFSAEVDVLTVKDFHLARSFRLGATTKGAECGGTCIRCRMDESVERRWGTMCHRYESIVF